MSDKRQKSTEQPKGSGGVSEEQAEGRLSRLGGLVGGGRGQQEGLAASEALWAGSVSADHLRGRVCAQTDDGEGEALSEIRPTRLSLTGAEAVKRG